VAASKSRLLYASMKSRVLSTFSWDIQEPVLPLGR
jgi:hypothetical protein